VYYFDLKIKEIRKKKGLSQRKMANILNTTQQQVSKYETLVDAPSLNRLVEIAQILGVSLDDLVKFKKIHHEYSSELKNKIIK
jgi:transcriptional regulator with XRE-family HTH domain